LYQGTALAVPQRDERNRALAPVMALPARHANPDKILSSSRTFFVTTKTSMGRALLQSERNATLFIDVLRSYATDRKFELHDFVVMPDHVHLLMTIDGTTTIERAMQLIKAGFSFRLKKEFGYVGEVWQRGFSEVRVNDRESYGRHREYISQNPVEARLVDSPGKYPFCLSALARLKAQGLKPENQLSCVGTAKAVP
jgi:putative transposase